MPTVTTTVTSAAACGKTTTVTTTEASPDTGAPSNSASDVCKEMVGVWASGNLKTDYKKFWSSSAQISAGPGKVRGWGSYSFATIPQWLDELEGYHFHGMNWTFYPRPGGAVGEWTVDSLECKKTGKKAAGFTGCNLFDVDASGMITALNLIFDFSLVEAVFSSDMQHCEDMVASWAQGKLGAERNIWFADNLEVDAGSSTAPGFGKYTMATFDDWIGDLGVYDFNDMDWTFYPTPDGAVGEWTVSSMGRKETGKTTGPMTGINRFTMSDGKITKVRINNNDVKQVEALF